MKKKKIVTIVAAVLVAGLLVRGKMLLNDRKAEMEGQATPLSEQLKVPLVKAVQGELENKAAFLAELDADKSITLSTKLAGYVESVHVQEAQVVKKGELLVSIDTTELKANITALQATLNAQTYDLKLAKSIYSRNIKLNKIGGLAKEKLDLSKASVDSKTAQLANTKQKIIQLENQLSYLQIKAPFDGTVDRVLLHQGDLAAAGKPIISMSNAQQKLRFSFAPNASFSIKKGQLVYMVDKAVGKIRAIYPTAQNGLVMAEVAVDEKIDLPSGSSVNIEVLTQAAEGCLLPDTTLLHKKEGTFLMAYDNGTFVPMAVQVLLQEKNKILVKPCPKVSVANASEVRLAQLPAHNQNDESAGEK